MRTYRPTCSSYFAVVLGMALLGLVPLACSPPAPGPAPVAPVVITSPPPPVSQAPVLPPEAKAPVKLSAGPIAGQVRAYGWSRPAVKPLPQTRFRLRMPQFAAPLPGKVDLRAKDVPVYDQGQLGSCTANGWGDAVEYRAKNLPVKPVAVSTWDSFLMSIGWISRPAPPVPAFFMPSRLFIYYGERNIEGTIGQDAGAAVADGAKVVSTLGVAPESMWPYDVRKFAVKPPAKVYAEALKHVTPAPSSIDTGDLVEVKTALALGHPIVFGFDVYASFESVGDDGVYTPQGGDVGGHCVVAVGYDDAKGVVIVRNSWGTSWGDEGYFYFPYRHFASNMTSDAWSIAEPIVAAAGVPLPAPAPVVSTSAGRPREVRTPAPVAPATLKPAA